KIQPKQKHGNDDDRRRALDFLARRRRDFLHLRAHVAVKTFDPLGPGSQRACNRVRFYCCRHTFPLSSTAPSRASTLAGAEGFEPPSSVLETDSLTVELTPLKTVLSSQLSVLSQTRPLILATGCWNWQPATSLLCAACACG